MSLSILDRLAARHADAVFVNECAMGSRQNGCRRLDAWVLLKTWSPFTVIGYEVKANRADFLRDRKWSEYLPVCHELYFACPVKLIVPEELPQDVGLLWTAGEARLITKRKAIRREPDPVALVRLMTYVLMSRTRIVGDMWEARNRESREQFWRRWLAEGAEAKALGHEVGKKIRERLHEAEHRQHDAEMARGRLEHVEQKLIALGLDKGTDAWRLERAASGQKDERAFAEIARLARRIGVLAEPTA